MLNIHSLVGLNDEPGRFGVFLLAVFLINLVGISLGLAVSSLVSDVETASALGVPLNIIGILFGGFYITVDALPLVANLLPNFSLLRWALQLFSINEFKGMKFNCDATDPSRCILTGEEALEYMDFNGHTIEFPLFGLLMLLVGWVVVGYFILLMNQKRYLRIGHVGAKYERLRGEMVSTTSGGADANQIHEADVVLSGTSTSAHAEGYEMVATTDVGSKDTRD